MLFGLGLLLAWFPFIGKPFDTLRIMGVMQRLALCYGMASLLVLFCSERVLFIITGAILLGYWAALSWGAMPDADPYGLEGSLARRIDLAVLGEGHLWKGKGIPFDPEGLLSTLPAMVNVLIGWWSGRIMQRYSLNKMRVVGELLLWGNILALNGVVWDLWFPMNKSLWTSSFVLYTGGLSMIFMAFAVWVLDVKSWTRGLQFFLVFGANSLFAYLLAGFAVKTMISFKWAEGDRAENVMGWLYHHLFEPVNAGKTGSLLFALTFMLLCWLVCYILYKKRIFIKI